MFASDDHPAAQANIRSFAAVVAKDKEGWLDLFAADAVVEDPVGVSGLDPTGEGHRGREAIARFWDTVIAPGELSFDVRMRVPRGDECAVMTGLENRAGGVHLESEMIVIYRVDAEGKIVSLRAFWDYEAVQQKITELAAAAEAK